MYKKNRIIALMVSIVMIFSLVLNPLSMVYAEGIAKDIPTITIPNINETINVPPQIKDTKIKNPPNSRLTKIEPAARAKGVTYKLKDGIKRLPESMDYNLKQIELADFASFETDSEISGSKVPPTAGEAPEKQGIDFNKINGIRYNPGSKYMVVPKGTSANFTPNSSDIYIDENEGIAYRVLDNGKVDAEGNSQYTVETPTLTDIFESYKIPAQDIKLTTGNIAYLAPGVELDPRSGMEKNYYAAADNGYISGYKHEGNKHILNLTANKIIFKYPSKEEEKKTQEEKEKAEKEKFQGDWWAKEQNADLRGFEEESELQVEVAIKEGTIEIEDPTFHADFDLNWLTTQVKADFYFESKTKADVTFVGDLSFNKTLEACIFGYDIDLGKVLGKERGNRAFVGIFLVLGVNGKVHVEVRTIATGNARAGYAFKAIGYGLIPYSVGPYVTYRPTGFDVNFNVSGEIHAVLACVPQVGVIIWGTEIGALQIWLGVKADAKFSASGGGGSSGENYAVAKGSLDIKGFAEMIGILFDKKYSIFYLDFPIYKGEWEVGKEVAGGGGDAFKEVTPSFFVKADASTNVAEGKIVFGKDNKPFSNKKYALEIWNSGKLKATLPGMTDGEGKFEKNTSADSYNLIPSDKVVINIGQGKIGGVNVDAYFVIGNEKYKLTTTKSKEFKATVPFTSLDFNVDTFNDMITGTVSGKYTGPVDIKVVNMDFSERKYVVNAVNGIFTLPAPINERTYNVWGEINFEGSKFPDNQGVCRTPNLDALEINFYNEFAAEEDKTIDVKIEIPTYNIPGIKPPKNLSAYETANLNEDDEGNKVIRPTKIFGAIINKGEMAPVEIQGDAYIRNPRAANSSVKSFTGSVKITALPIKSAILDIINKRDHSNLTDPIVNSSGWTTTSQAQPAIFDGEATSAATFEFINPEVLAYTIEIEYEGLRIEERYNPFVFHYEKTLQDINEFARQPVQKEVTIVTENKKDAIVNPNDMMNIGNIMNPGNVMSPGNNVNIENSTIPGNITNNLNQGSGMKQSSIATPANAGNQWNGKWSTQIGTMDLIQDGNAVEGYIMQGTTAYTVEGKVSDGVFKGSILIPSAGSLFGDIITVEMNISADGKSVSFKNIGGTSELKSLNGTKAIKQ